MQLTMASAIARSGADPWQEAARIAGLPQEIALQVLARFVPAQHDASNAENDQITTDRLLSLLPKQSPQRPIGRIKMAHNRSMHMAFVLTFCAVLVILAHFAAMASHPEAPASVPITSSPTAIVH